MKRTFTIVLSTFLIGVLIYSCGKYEDGPGFTLLSKKKRLKGEWELKTIDGNSIFSIYSYEDSVSTSCFTEIPYKNETVYDYYRLEFEKDGDVDFTYSITTTTVELWDSYAACTAVYDVNVDIGLLKGDWEWEDKKEDIEITIGNQRTVYEILRLTKDELKLETVYGEIWEFEKD